MAKDADLEARKIAAVQKRWQELQKKEEEKKLQLAQRVKKPSIITKIIGYLNDFFQTIGEFFMRPLHAIHDALVQAKKARKARKKAKIEKMRPILEAKALKRIEKKHLKQAKKEAKLLAAEAARQGKLPFGERFVQGFNEKSEAFAHWLASPGHAFREMQHKSRLKKQAKQKAKLDKTAAARERLAQKKHRRLVRKAQKQAARKARSKERWRWVREKRAQFKEFWDYTVVVRRLIYLIALITLIYIKRDYIFVQIESVIGYDLQRLLH
ncbi:MAG: hypothetical protein JEZ02_13460 [Desulfatibacillum sp.]|nr:hypothetical protein [Desulfatibacillum sp.]